MCLRCGLAVRRQRGFVCPDCGEDWYSRPPRSYAELEQVCLAATPVDQGGHFGHRLVSLCARLIRWPGARHRSGMGKPFGDRVAVPQVPAAQQDPVRS